jgi:TRAP-type C4-dicarboxylate transport system substrate-binding protein
MESFEGVGLRPLWVMTTPPYQLMMRQAEPIESAEDLAGKQLRVAGATSQLVAASLGASPATIPPADLYQSLERGVVDGALYTLAAMRAYNLQEVTASYTTNAKLGGIAFITFINLDTWNSLPAEVQQVLDEVGSEVGVSLAKAIDETQEETIDFLRDLDKNVYALSDEVSEALDERLRTVQQEWVRQMEQRGLPGSETLDAFMVHLAD